MGWYVCLLLRHKEMDLLCSFNSHLNPLIDVDSKHLFDFVFNTYLDTRSNTNGDAIVMVGKTACISTRVDDGTVVFRIVLTISQARSLKSVHCWKMMTRSSTGSCESRSWHVRIEVIVDHQWGCG